MGPLAGMGDSIIWAAVMPLLIAIFIPFAANGSAMGGILPLILYPAITLAISYGMVHKGYTLGRDSIISLLQGGRIKELIYGANVLGLIMMGALSASFVKITSPLKISALKGSGSGGTADSGLHRARPAAAGGSVRHLLLFGEKGSALHHDSAVDCGVERGLLAAGSAVSHDAEYLSTTGTETGD